MDKRYVTLFKDLAQATAASAETVMEYDKQKEDEKGLETATIMRDDFQNLTDFIASAGDEYAPTKDQVAKLLVGSIVMVSQLQDKLEAVKKAIAGYQTDLIPKLQKIVETATTDEEAQKMANETFVIIDSKE